MTASATPDMPATQRLTYPVSPDYVASWTADRAIAELVANAIDEDPTSFRYEWKNGVLAIEDFGAGIPEEGLVLGYSAKRKKADSIGQFGEGKKISALVLARDRQVGRVRFETVGYAFEPTITTAKLVAINARRETEAGAQMLAYDFEPCDRTRGTRITIECSKRLADKVRKRFRHFEPGYEPVPAGGLVIDDGGGTIYIGGVQVATGRKLVFSYDFALADAKAAQNRDRTVIDSQVQDRLISQALNACKDEAILEKWIDAALSGELPRAEQMYWSSPDPAMRRALRSIAKRRFSGKVCYVDAATPPEATLYCRERGYDVIEDRLGGVGNSSVQNLLRIMGVKSATSLYREPKREVTEWVKTSDLTDDERVTLTEAVELMQAVYGEKSVGRVDAYETTRLQDEDQGLAFGGFYDPRSKRIGIQRGNLASLADTVRVLGHEVAHLRRHKVSDYDYKDNSRGFESELDGMLARALMLVRDHGVLDKVAAEQEAADRAAADAEQAKEAAEVEREATHPAGMVRRLLADAMEAKGLSSAKDAADEAGISVGGVKQMLKGARRNGHRQCPAPRLKTTKAFCEALGVGWSVVHLGMLTEAGIVVEEYWTAYGGHEYPVGFTRRGRKREVKSDGRTQWQPGPGRIMGVRGDEMAACIARLRELGTDEALVAVIESHLNAPFDFEDESWQEPYRALLAQETDALGA